MIYRYGIALTFIGFIWTGIKLNANMSNKGDPIKSRSTLLPRNIVEVHEKLCTRHGTEPH